MESTLPPKEAPVCGRCLKPTTFSGLQGYLCEACVKQEQLEILEEALRMSF